MPWEGPLGTAGTIILITSAGGAFGAMIRHAGVGDAISAISEGSGFSLIILAWLVAAVLKGSPRLRYGFDDYYLWNCRGYIEWRRRHRLSSDLPVRRHSLRFPSRDLG